MIFEAYINSSLITFTNDATLGSVANARKGQRCMMTIDYRDGEYNLVQHPPPHQRGVFASTSVGGRSEPELTATE